MSRGRAIEPLAVLRRWWNGLSLARQFVVAGSAVLLAGMAVIGLWVSDRIRDSVTSNAAVTTALYVDSVIAPMLPDLRASDELGEGPRRALDETLAQGALGSRLVSFKLWKERGRILYANEAALIGQRFDETESLKKAWAGSVAAEFDELTDDENILERTAGMPLLEIYSPIREPWSGEVVAVAEFYEMADELADQLARVEQVSWFVVAAVTFTMMGLLSGIVLRGSGVIAQQRAALEDRVDDLSALLAQNTDLRLRVQRASRRATDMNERFLRRVSADLHDGPAQLVALAALRMGSERIIEGRGDDAARRDDVLQIRQSLDEAIAEIRSISQGLTLPQLDGEGTAGMLDRAVGAHRQRTGDDVEFSAPAGMPDLAASEKICVYRFVQEALHNAHRHAAGARQKVEVHVDGPDLVVSVADDGPGFAQDMVSPDRLGLAGLRDRVESIGGTFAIDSSGAGTRLTMQLNLEDRTGA